MTESRVLLEAYRPAAAVPSTALKSSVIEEKAPSTTDLDAMLSDLRRREAALKEKENKVLEVERFLVKKQQELEHKYATVYQEALENSSKEIEQRFLALEKRFSSIVGKVEQGMQAALLRDDFLADIVILLLREILLGMRVQPHFVMEYVKKAVGLVGESLSYRVYLSPLDFEKLNLMLSDGQQLEKIQVFSRESIDLGGCVVETDCTQLDAEFRTQLSKIAEEVFSLNVLETA